MLPNLLTSFAEVLDCLGVDVIDDELVATLDQVSGHMSAHVAKTNEANKSSVGCCKLNHFLFFF